MLRCPRDCDGYIETVMSNYDRFRCIECKGFMFRNTIDFFNTDNTLDYVVNMNIDMLKRVPTVIAFSHNSNNSFYALH